MRSHKNRFFLLRVGRILYLSADQLLEKDLEEQYREAPFHESGILPKQKFEHFQAYYSF